MIELLVALAASFAASLALETAPPSLGAFRAPVRVLVLRAAVHLVLFSAAFAVSWRPWHAALVVCATVGLFGVGSAIKRGILGEPLVFSDAALVRLAIRHPRLYYAERLAEPRALLAMASLLAATVAWFAVERPILPRDGAFLLVLPPAVGVGLVALLASGQVARFAQATVGGARDASRDVDRFGLIASIALHWIAWRSAERPSPEARAAAAALPRPSTASARPLVVVAIQCESLVDIAARGLDGPALPALAKLRSEAIAWGRCRVPAEGAYTMRSEFGFLTGLPTGALGLDAFDPYLRAEAYVAVTLPGLLAAAGFRTAAIHPYDRRFFERERILPLLGFERFVDGRAFADAARFGPYVADSAVADALVAEIRGAREPTFLFAITIENHGPWGPGRLPDTDDPAAQYASHLVNADAMIGRVAAALAAAPGGGVLCLYGDHAPARGLHPDLPDRRATDYVLWDTRPQFRTRPAERRDLAVDGLTQALLAHV